jgi:hypothetical protein
LIDYLIGWSINLTVRDGEGFAGMESFVHVIGYMNFVSTGLLSCCPYVLFLCLAVYHVTADGWKKVRGDDVTECHFEYYPDPAAHPSAGAPVI